MADSAFYTGETLECLGQHTFWISQVGTIAEEQDLVNTDREFQRCKDPRHSHSEHSVEYIGIPQKGVAYYSEIIHDRQETIPEGNLEKVRISLKKLFMHEFVCEPDARAAAERWREKHPRYRF